MIRIKVPATSANLAVGYDCMGMAVNLYNTFEFSPSDVLRINGCPKDFQNEDNLVYRAFLKGCQNLDQEVPKVAIQIKSDIPVSRGLGSSATCIVAGIVAAYVWFHVPVNHKDVLKLANEMEGHPDNVAPAIFGGLCMSFVQDGEIELINYPINQDYRFVAIIPNFKVSTEAARSILPHELSYADVTYQVSHSLLLVNALASGELNKLKIALQDKMQEPYRQKLIKNYVEVKKICDKINCAMYISGSGSTLMGIADSDEKQKLMIKKITEHLPAWRVEPVQVENQGVKIEVL
ncbi:homoserine kinase [Fructilactobacillus sp. Tb1]|uniref:homoserine kinase n=1 Tax=Fructilactobacillus sp. Tb1 TaxID=3422304 RepID=UPI003D2A50F4